MTHVLDEMPARRRPDPLVAGVLRAIGDLPEPDRSVLRLRYGIGGTWLGEDAVAARLGMTVRELWQAESAALETIGFLLLTEVSVFELIAGWPDRRPEDGVWRCGEFRYVTGDYAADGRFRAAAEWPSRPHPSLSAPRHSRARSRPAASRRVS